MKLLVLGGTKFLGRAVAAAALARGHEVTLLNRGITNPQLYPEAEKLRGDLTAGVDVGGRIWDAAIDLDPTQRAGRYVDAFRDKEPLSAFVVLATKHLVEHNEAEVDVSFFADPVGDREP